MSSAQLGAFMEKFRALTLERLVRLNQLFMQWQDNPQDTTCLRDMQRELHNLKGEAKLMNLGNIAEVVHRIEDHVAAAPPPGQQRSEVDSRILAGFDLLGALVTQETGDDLTARWQGYVARSSSGESAVQPSPWSGDTGRLALRSAQAQHRRSRRVDMQKLDAVADITGDLLLTQGRLAQSLKKLQALADRDGKDGKEVEAGLEQARRWLAQQQNDIEKLEAAVRDMRLVPLRTLVDTFERTLRDLAYEQGKEVRLTQENTGVGIDSDVLERLGEPMLQLLVNGVVHGIEPPNVRIQQGKPARGVLLVAIRPGTSVVDIDVSDDGAGVQLPKVREVATSRHLVNESDAPGEETLLEIIFQPGFTTRGNVSDVAGRGVGLDAVRAQVAQLGGTVNVRSIRGTGTTFTISVPTSMLWVRALLVRWEQQYFAIPADAIFKVMRLDDAAANNTAVRVGQATVTMTNLGTLLGLPPCAEEAGIAIVVRHEKRVCALRVQQVMGERQVVQRRVDAASAHLPYHSGTVTLENGARAGLLNIPLLLDEVRQMRLGTTTQPFALVVDDSDLVRERVATMLAGAGFRVARAGDGVAALRMLERERPDIIVSDYEMPHLDGLGLLSAVRRQPELQSVPFVIVSAKDGDVLQTRGQGPRPHAWINKANLDDATFLDLMRQLCGTGTEGP